MFFSLFLFIFASRGVALGTGRATSEEQEQIETEQLRLNNPKIKTGVSSYYFDMYGERAATDNLYSFGTLSLWLQLFSLETKISQNWTILALGQYIQNSSQVYVGQNTFIDHTEGLGDTVVSLGRPLWSQGRFLLLVDAGLSLPTGQIDIKNRNNPKFNDIYTMQLGSGTFDGVIGLTPLWLANPWQVGARAVSTVRVGDNQLGYRWGDQYKLDGWLDYAATTSLSPRLELDYTYKTPMSGSDPTLGRTVWTESFYHPSISYYAAAALKYQTDLSKNLAVSGEVGWPFFQNCLNSDHVVVNTRYFASISLNGAF